MFNKSKREKMSIISIIRNKPLLISPKKVIDDVFSKGKNNGISILCYILKVNRLIPTESTEVYFQTMMDPHLTR